MAHKVGFNSFPTQNSDANSYIEPGEYAVYKGYTTNIPSHASTFGVIKVLDYGGSGDRIIQVYYSLDDVNSPATRYFRHTYHVYNQSYTYAWSSWIRHLSINTTEISFKTDSTGRGSIPLHATKVVSAYVKSDSYYCILRYKDGSDQVIVYIRNIETNAAAPANTNFTIIYHYLV